MKEKLLKIKDMISRAVQSDWFIAFNAALILIGWAFDIWIPMICVVFVIHTIPLFLDRHTKHLFNVLIMFSFIMSSDRNQMMKYAPLLALVGLLVAGMIFNLIFFKRSFKPLHPKNIRGFHASLLALLFPMALAGAASPAEVPLFTLALVALTVVYGFIYSFFVVCNDNDEEKKQLTDYLLKILVASGIVVSLEMLIFYGRIGDVNEIVQAMMAKKVHLGWAGPNNMAPLLSMTIPATLYFCIRKNYATPLLATLALVEYALIIATGCRGAILFTTLAMPAMLLYVIVKSENKTSFGVTVSIVFIIAVIIVAYYGNIFANIITTILNKRLDSSGRDELYQLAVDTFKTWPLFGAGWDYKTDLYYHSTFFQILATMGIFGLIIFAVFYFWRYKTFFKTRKEPSTMALLCGTVLFEAYGMIDTNYFVPNFFLILLLMTLVVELNVPEKTCLAFGGKDPVAHVVNYFRILADKVKPIKPQSSSGENGAETAPAQGDAQTQNDAENSSIPALTNESEGAAVSDKPIEGEAPKAGSLPDESSDDDKNE